MISLFLLSLAVLLMEVCLTRIFSVLSWHHFAYLIISLALLGFGAAGSYVTVSRRFSKAEADNVHLGHFAWIFSLTAIGAIAVASKVRFYPVDIVRYHDYSNALSLLILYILVGIPFFFAGVCIGRLVALAGDRVNQFYFADLLGAGIGALAALVVINQLGAVSGIFLAAGLGAIAASLLGTGGMNWRRWAYGLTVVSALGLTFLTAWTNILPLYYPPSKIMFRQEDRIEYSRWHVVGKIDIIKPTAGYFHFGGALAKRYTDPPPPVQGILQDGWAPTGIMLLNDPPVQVSILGEYLQGIAYTVQPPRRVLIIGVGGGVDALIAMHHGAEEIVGVDLNPVIVHAVTELYRDRSPALWSGGRVKMVVAEGRHYLTATDATFDVIQLSGVDTFTALSTGAFVLSENYLYTRGAMRDYWNHLSADGILSFSRLLFDPPRETLRLITTQLDFLARTGIAEPWRHFVVIGGPAYEKQPPWAETLLKRSAFTREQVERLTQWAEERGFDILYDPYHTSDNAFNTFIRADTGTREQLIEAYPFNVRPTSDDDPFFFQYYRWRSLLRLTSGRSGLAGSKGGYSVMRVPLGLIILALSLVQMLVLSLVFIIAPLRMLTRFRSPGRGRFGIFLYFSALGLGFIFIEIALLQKFSVFVGGPTSSMAITLASILVFSGVGSYVAKAFRERPGRWLAATIVLLGALTAAEIAFLNRALPDLLRLSLPLRWLVTGAAIFPLAVLMGMPFPTGLRLVQRVDESMRPWAWGVNACATVVGSMLCVLLSIYAGFTTTLLTAVGIYFIGGLGMMWTMWRNRTAVLPSSQ